MRLAGKVALITGGSKGQGACEARVFAEHGAVVVIGDILDRQGRAVAGDIVTNGGSAIFVHLDVSSAEDWDRAMSTAMEAYGKLNVLVNNAGITGGGPIESASEEDWHRVMDTNAKGVFLGTRAVIPVMREAGGGSIVNISSTAGLVGNKRGGAYSASKAAIRQLTKATAIQHAPDGIRANVIHPGPIMTDQLAPSVATPEARAAFVAQVPMGMIGEPEDVAHAALYLASDEARFVTGADLVIDGGLTAQ